MLALPHREVRSARPGGMFSLEIAEGNPKGQSFAETLLLTFSVLKVRPAAGVAFMPFFDCHPLAQRVTFEGRKTDENAFLL